VKPAVAQEKAAPPEKPHKPEKSDKPEKTEKADKPESPRKAEKSRAEALLNDAKPPESAKSAYVIQLGAYKDEANVKTLRAKLKAEGYTSYTEQVGDRTRVRAGPFPSKEAADKAAKRIQSVLGVSAMVASK
ncbi:MAG: SPOR domain-containing protein, partial [Zoogloea sp.]|nr:SPOR domain-containing protein [Zoogloea sp.]